MAIIHDAQLRPGKLEILAAWVPRQPWAPAAEGDLRVVATYRFDDPAGEVGMETFLLRGGDGPLLQVPLSYRGAPLEGAQASLVAELDHSVLGTRWVYDALADPVYAAVLAQTVRTGGREAALQDADGNPIQRPNYARVQGSGVDPADPVTRLTLLRVLDGPLGDVPVGAPALTGTWVAGAEPTVLAVAA